jgi:hypothetical protein
MLKFCTTAVVKNSSVEVYYYEVFQTAFGALASNVKMRIRLREFELYGLVIMNIIGFHFSSGRHERVVSVARFCSTFSVHITSDASRKASPSHLKKSTLTKISTHMGCAYTARRFIGKNLELQLFTYSHHARKCLLVSFLVNIMKPAVTVFHT